MMRKRNPARCAHAAMLPAVAALAFAGASVRTALAQLPASFTNEAIARGIDYLVGFTHPQFGAGVGFIDLDSDSDLDVVVLGRSNGVVGVYENDGAGVFTDRSATSGLPLMPTPSALAAADYDGDGDLDLFFSNWLAPHVLMRNDGGFQFTNVAADAGLDETAAGMGCAWGDVDGDTLLDLFVPTRTGTGGSDVPNRFFMNGGDGTFDEIGSATGIDRGADPTLVVGFLDYDRDGDADLYLGNDKGSVTELTNHLFRNDGGTFTDVTAETGTEANVDCMGIAVGDLTRNGLQDLYVTNTPPGNVLLLQQPDHTFLDESALAGVQSFVIGWGTLFFDYDNDAWLELYVCNTTAANRLYDYDGAWPASDDGPALAVGDIGASYCVAKGDVDGDGDLDLLVASVNAKIRLYINNEGESRSWIRFRVRGIGANVFAVGAQVDVRAGSVWQMDEVRSGTAYKSQDELTLHFGLDDAVQADEIVVTWPGGITRTLGALPAGNVWTLYHPTALADGDGDGDVELDDLVVFAGCHGGPVAPGCEMMDIDGDGDVDDDDFAEFLTRYTGPLDDCNGNEIDDIVEIVSGAVVDANANGVPDGCECAADLDGSGDVGFADLLAILSSWGPCGACPEDLDGNGDVAFADLLAVLSTWGPCS